MLLLGKEALIHYLKKYEPSFTWKVSLRTTALSMLTCIYISEQVLCQQFRTWTLFLLQCSLQPNLLALYFRRLELVAVSAREPSSSSFPTLNPHLTLQPAIPKRFLWRPLWDLPFEPQYTGSRSSTLPTLVFPEYKVLWTHEHVDVDIHLLKIKKNKLEKKTPHQPQKPPEELPAGQSTLISASPGREVKDEQVTLSVPMPARKASWDSHVCSTMSHQDPCFIQRDDSWFPCTVCATTSYRTKNSNCWVFLLGAVDSQVPYQGLGVLALWK